MKKIKINKLPEGFKLVDGKVVETKFMRDGGDTYTTGDQADYGLVTTPQNYYGSTTFNNSDDESVRFSLSSVPRDNANIEAEGGETVLTDLNDDGSFGLYDIHGPRHSKGGVPMYLPEQSFIYSDTPKLKFTKEEMSEFDVGGEKKTPAKISKKFGLNEFYGELDSQYADEISSTSAELMLKKNMGDLSKLAFVQEAKKDFSDGVPLASHPYLMSIGQDPIEFTAKMEQISMQKAEQNAFDALPPQQQQQILMLQQMMAQAEQQNTQQEAPQQAPQQSMQQDPSMNPQLELAEADNSMMANAKYGSELPIAQDGNKEKPLKNPFPSGSDEAKQFDEYAANDEYEISIVDGQVRVYKAYQSRFDGDTKVETQEVDGVGAGSTPTLSKDQRSQGAVLDASPIGSYRPGIYSGGNRPESQGAIYENQIVDGVYDANIVADKSTPIYAYGSAKLKSAEGQADFEARWGDVTSQIEGFDYTKPGNDPQWKEFQVLAEETRKNESEQLDIPYVPHFRAKGSDGYIDGEDFDGALGLHTFNTPRLDVDFTSQEEIFMDLPEKEIPPSPVPVPALAPKNKWWAQDLNNMAALGKVNDNLYLPWAPQLEDQNIDYVLDDYTGAVNANLGAQNTMAQALGAYGPQQIARSNIQGATLAANAQAINKVNQNNVRTMNQVATLQPQLDMKVDIANNATNTALYDNTNAALQNADNFANWRTGKQNELFNKGATNMANTANLNSTNDLYKINPDAYGLINFTGEGRKLYEDSSANEPDFLEFYSKLNKNNLGEKPVDMKTANEIFERQYGMQPSGTKGAVALENRVLDGSYQSNSNVLQENDVEEGKRGKETKRWATPFYSGKMGV
jgi:hypothetical protein